MSSKGYLSDCDFSNSDYVITFSLDVRERACYFYKVGEKPPACLGNLLDFFNIWEKTGGPNLPAWKDFKFEQFLGWHANMRVLSTGTKLEETKKNIIVGSTFGEYWGTKTFQSRLRDGSITSEEIIRKYKEYHDMVHDQYFVINAGYFRSETGNERGVLMLDMPLAEDGKNVSHLIAAMVSV